MDIRGLGYIGVAVADVAAWRDYAELLGTMVLATDGEDSFRMKIDDRPFRVVVSESGGGEGLAFAGWELPDAAALDRAEAELKTAGFAVEQPTESEMADRLVRGMIRTTDPAGFSVELFWGPIHDHRVFVSPAGVSGFVTGEMGLGHIVLGVPDISAAVDFYIEVLGFRVSDYWRAGAEDVVFTHCNPRHHSLALVPATEAALYHFMIEAQTLDDVGYTLDRHADNGVPVAAGLGKHTNDRMVSFYSQSPSTFEVEFGFGGIRVDDATWTVSEITKPSFWGHRRSGG